MRFDSKSKLLQSWRQLVFELRSLIGSCACDSNKLMYTDMREEKEKGKKGEGRKKGGGNGQVETAGECILPGIRDEGIIYQPLQKKDDDRFKFADC